jgi:TrpR-related protein YerC/YecD
MSDKWLNKKSKNLFKAFTVLKNETEVANFCRDLMTEAEIEAFAGRWDVAQKLNQGKSQREVASESGISIATVTRVNQWLKRGRGGYKLALERISKLHHARSKLA